MFPNTYFVSTYYPDTYFPPPGDAAQPDVGNFRNWDFAQGKAPQAAIVNVMATIRTDIEPLRHETTYQLTAVADAISQTLRGDVHAIVCPGTQLPEADGRLLFKTEAVAHETSHQILPHAAGAALFEQKIGGKARGKATVKPTGAARPKRPIRVEAAAADAGLFTAKGYDNLTDEELITIVTRRRKRRNAGKN